MLTKDKLGLLRSPKLIVPAPGGLSSSQNTAHFLGQLVGLTAGKPNNVIRVAWYEFAKTCQRLCYPGRICEASAIVLASARRLRDFHRPSLDAVLCH